MAAAEQIQMVEREKVETLVDILLHDVNETPLKLLRAKFEKSIADYLNGNSSLYQFGNVSKLQYNFREREAIQNFTDFLVRGLK